MSSPLPPPVPVFAAGRDSGTGLPLRRQAVFPPFFTAGTGQSYVFRDKKKEHTTTFSTILTVCLFFSESPFYPLAQPPGPVMDYNPRFGRPTARKAPGSPSAPRMAPCAPSGRSPETCICAAVSRKHGAPRPARKRPLSTAPETGPSATVPRKSICAAPLRTLRPDSRSGSSSPAPPSRRPAAQQSRPEKSPPKSREAEKSAAREAHFPPPDARPIPQKVAKSTIKDNIAKKMK